MPEHTDHGNPPADREVRPMDLALDKAQGTFVYVIDKEARTVSEYMATREGQNLDRHLLDFAGNWLTGANEGDAVYRCTYLPSNVKSFPSQSYVFPESRLARVPVELVRDMALRPQDQFAQELLTDLMRELAGTPDPDMDMVKAMKKAAHGAGVSEEAVNRATKHFFDSVEAEQEDDEEAADTDA